MVPMEVGKVPREAKDYFFERRWNGINTLMEIKASYKQFLATTQF